MNGYLSSVGCDQMHWLVENEDMAHSFFYSPEDCTVKPTCESGADQAWFLLHCTLTGDFDTDTSTHPMALFSAGTEFGPMLSYGFAKYLTPEVAGTISDSELAPLRWTDNHLIIRRQLPLLGSFHTRRGSRSPVPNACVLGCRNSRCTPTQPRELRS